MCKRQKIYTKGKLCVVVTEIDEANISICNIISEIIKNKFRHDVNKNYAILNFDFNLTNLNFRVRKMVFENIATQYFLRFEKIKKFEKYSNSVDGVFVAFIYSLKFT